jgi:hypothetical protein
VKPVVCPPVVGAPAPDEAQKWTARRIGRVHCQTEASVARWEGFALSSFVQLGSRERARDAPAYARDQSPGAMAGTATSSTQQTPARSPAVGQLAAQQTRSCNEAGGLTQRATVGGFVGESHELPDSLLVDVPTAVDLLVD